MGCSWQVGEVQDNVVFRSEGRHRGGQKGVAVNYLEASYFKEVVLGWLLDPV